MGPREDYERLEHSRVLARVDQRPVWSVVCFVVSRKERGQGIARELLGAAVDYAREHGATIVESYPVETGGERIPAASAYLGTTRMFEQAGFREVATRQATPTSRPRPIFRLAL
jgi:GNAT superfamily N-acetyltransferase